MDAEQRAAIEIANRYDLVSRSEGGRMKWVVPDGPDSEPLRLVTLDPESCTCPTFARREGREGYDRCCRHILAVVIDGARNGDLSHLDGLPFVVSDTRPKLRRAAADGSPMQPLPLPTAEERRITKQSKHHRHRAVDRDCVTHLPRLLYELCRYIPDWEDKREGGGRPPVPLSDIVFCCVYAAALDVPSRELPPHLEAAKAAGYITTAPFPNVILKYTRDPKVWPYFQRLIVHTAIQFRDIDRYFAIDSTKMYFGRLLARRPNARGDKIKNDRVKLHGVCGLRSLAFNAVEVSHKDSHDGNYLIPLVRETAERVTKVAIVCADGSYSWNENFEYLEGIGAFPYLDFREDSTGKSGESRNRWLQFSRTYPDHWDKWQDRRRRIEAAWKGMKDKYGRHVPGKTPEAAVGGVLCKVVCHNIRRVINGAYLFGIRPDFWPYTER